MGVSLRAIVKENTEAGEFLNSVSGELIKYESGSMCYVWLPHSDYPDLIKIKGCSFPPKTEGIVTLDFSIKKEQLRAKLSNFRIKTA